ncbi:SgcJ/EcaC family oxidoreductase [Jeotgalibacillus sp. ET6]|uniref:SgcJ/EcaC family oxidoreductase n=1 Tax=Jeotgalibacillus sp. ET6 TaxID=3037260 RepID=UPI003014A98D
MVKKYEEEIKGVYNQLTTSWNERNAQGMASLFSESGESIGFDGSVSKGPKEIAANLEPIFRDHPTAPYVIKIK